MHQTDLLGSKPRFLRASLLTGAAVAVLPSIFFAFAYIDFISPEWDAANDSGVVQGYFFLGVSSVLAVLFAVVAFPAIALLLRRKFSRTRFVGALIVLLALVSTGVGVMTASALGDFRMASVLASLFLALASLLTLPFAWLWINLAANDA